MTMMATWLAPAVAEAADRVRPCADGILMKRPAQNASSSLENRRRSASERIFADEDGDPLGCRIALPFQKVFHPMGLPVEISSNSVLPIQVAEKLWRHYPAQASDTPVHLRVIVDSVQRPPIESPPGPRAQEHLVTIVHSPHDYATADLSNGFAFAVLSQSTAADVSYFRYYFLEPLVYLMQAAQKFLFVHASCVSRGGRGLVLCGDSGAGKTCLAYSCAKNGWDFVTGDAVHVHRQPDFRTIVGRPYEIRFRDSARMLFPELGDYPSERRANGKTDLEIDTTRLSIRLALSSKAHSIVFLERGDWLEVQRLSADYAAQRLESTICFGDEKIRREQRETLSQFVRLPVWRLRFSDPTQAERELSKLLDDESLCPTQTC